MKKVLIDMGGKRFGKLTVTDFYKTDKNGNAVWKCLCDCGETTWTKGINLRQYRALCCGCVKGLRRKHLGTLNSGDLEKIKHKSKEMTFIRSKITHLNAPELLKTPNWYSDTKKSLTRPISQNRGI